MSAEANYNINYPSGKTIYDYLNEAEIPYAFDESTGFLSLDFSSDRKNKNSKQLDVALACLDVNSEMNSDSDLLLHGTPKLTAGENLSEGAQVASSYFDQGLRGSSAGSGNVFGTASLRDDSQPYGEDIMDYQFYSNTTVIINIPRRFGDLYFGRCERGRAKGTSRQVVGNTSCLDIGEHMSIDHLAMKKIPKEFIVGLLYCPTPKEQRFSEEDIVNRKLILNPNYLAFTNNLQRLPDGRQVSNAEALRQEIEQAPGYSKFLEVVNESRSKEDRFDDLLELQKLLSDQIPNQDKEVEEEIVVEEEIEVEDEMARKAVKEQDDEIEALKKYLENNDLQSQKTHLDELVERSLEQ